MNYTLSSILIFTAGAAIGSAVTWRVLKNKYEKIAQEEIESVKAVFSKRGSRDDIDNTKEPESEDDIYHSLAHSYQAVDAVNTDEPGAKKNKGAIMTAPYVISPDEFDENEDYEAITLTYYADGILTDDMDNLVEDVEGTVGTDALGRIGEYEDDSVHVRNDYLKCDYEILLDVRRFADVISDRYNIGNTEV